jgi:PIN domain nuclease of toxin-antitoxin system
MLLLDTCALVWWTLDPASLSSRAREACDRIAVDGAFVSSISIWEIGIKMQKGTLDIGTTLQDYVARLKSIGALEILAVDEEIWVRNLALPWEHKDPADRTIVATAQLRDLPIMTKDDIISQFYTRIVW